MKYSAKNGGVPLVERVARCDFGGDQQGISLLGKVIWIWSTLAVKMGWQAFWAGQGNGRYVSGGDLLTFLDLYWQLIPSNGHRDPNVATCLQDILPVHPIGPAYVTYAGVIP